MAALLSGCVLMSAKVALLGIIGDNMVLQQKSQAGIWGWTKPGKEVRVEASWGESVSTKADVTGKWKVLINTPEASFEKRTITISDGDKVTLKDILIGEVWLCGGQSNMEMRIGDGVIGMEQTIADADTYVDRIRLLHVENSVCPVPQDEAKIRYEGWQKCKGKNIIDFSAAGYYFGKYLMENLNCPIGLIESCWGGTLAEAWTSRESLKEIPYFQKQLEKVAEIPVDIAARHQMFLKDIKEWGEEMKVVDPAFSERIHWCDVDYDDSSWKSIPVPGYIQPNGEPGFDGVFWERTTVEIPEGWEGKELVLHLGTVDDNDFTFFNGVEIGHTEGCMFSRDYTIPAELVKAGKAVIAVRVHDSGGLGGVFGDPDSMRLSMVDKNGREERIPITGKWKYRISMSLAKAPILPLDASKEANIVTGLYNAMINPIIDYRIAGAIWYQGESNTSRAAQYAELLPLMINDWRTKWGYSFPFYIVQIANFMAPQTGAEESDWAELRESQVKATNLENTGLACIIDLGESGDIHPKNKVDVGKRLALQALRKTYGKDVACESPSFRSYAIEGCKIRVTFDNAEGLKPAGETVEGFYIAGCDHVFHKADAVVCGQDVIVSSHKVRFPTAVRYAWANNPVCNLYNAAGLPAIPFRTDSYVKVKNY